MLEQTPERPRAASENEAGGCSPIPWPPAADAEGPQLHPSPGRIRLYHSNRVTLALTPTLPFLFGAYLILVFFCVWLALFPNRGRFW